jgi:perosamine synthetase
VTGDKTLIERARHFKGQGLANHREYWHDVIGYNYRMTNIAAAIGLAQLERASEFIERKRAIAARYNELLQDVPVEMHGESAGALHSYWMVSMLVERPSDRDPLRAAMADAGIETRPVFYPVHTMPMYARSYRKHAVAEDIAWRGINLPSWPGLSDEQLVRVAASVREFHGGRR